MNAIEEIRLARGRSQFEIAAACDIRLSRLQLIESGFNDPTNDELNRISDALDVNVTYLHILDDPSDDPLIKLFQEVARKTLGIKSDE